MRILKGRDGGDFKPQNTLWELLIGAWGWRQRLGSRNNQDPRLREKQDGEPERESSGIKRGCGFMLKERLGVGGGKVLGKGLMLWESR